MSTYQSDLEDIVSCFTPRQASAFCSGRSSPSTSFVFPQGQASALLVAPQLVVITLGPPNRRRMKTRAPEAALTLQWNGYHTFLRAISDAFPDVLPDP